MHQTETVPILSITNRARLIEKLEPNSVVVVNNNDIFPTNADGTFLLHPNADLFYLTGMEQEETRLLLFPDSHDPKFKEILFIRECSPLLATWEGHKLSREEAQKISGIKRIEWIGEFENIFHRVMCEADHVYLNSNEHKRAHLTVQTREARFVRDCREKYPLHQYHRLAKILHRLRVVKSQGEIEHTRKACSLTSSGFSRVARFLKPGVNEMEIEAEFAHEFIRLGGDFAYPPIIAGGKNSCVLHYVQNDRTCQDGELLLLDVAASYGNYNSDLTRTIPVNGRFTPRQKEVYNAVLRVLKASASLLQPGKLIMDWQKDSEKLVEEELLKLGLLKSGEVAKQDPENPLLKKYFMHGVGHPIGLDVHDVGITADPMEPGWIMTCEPAIYLVAEGFGVRLENDYLVTDGEPVNLLADAPIEADDIEALMGRS